MKAAVIGTLGTPPRVTTHPDPSPATGDQVLIKVEATALNAIDLHVAAGDHRAGPPQLPYVPGLEAAGTIAAGPDQGLRVRAVAPAGLVPGVNGGLAELLVASRAACIPVPDGLDSVAAAAIGAVGTSADLALRKAGLQAGESVLVLGATGPLGTAFLQLARIAGATRVIAAGRNRGRLAQVPAADSVAVLGEEPLSGQLASLGGCDGCHGLPRSQGGQDQQERRSAAYGGTGESGAGRGGLRRAAQGRQRWIRQPAASARRSGHAPGSHGRPAA